MQTHTHTGMKPKVQLQPIPRTQPSYGLFELHANNNKRRGGKSIRYVDAFGSLYPDGTVHIHTRELQIIDFTTLRQMREYLLGLGECKIVWIAGPLSTKIEEETVS